MRFLATKITKSLGPRLSVSYVPFSLLFQLDNGILFATGELVVVFETHTNFRYFSSFHGTNDKNRIEAVTAKQINDSNERDRKRERESSGWMMGRDDERTNYASTNWLKMGSKEKRKSKENLFVELSSN